MTEQRRRTEETPGESVGETTWEDKETAAAVPEEAADMSELLPDEDMMYDLAELFRMFADSTRVKILYVLFEKELCVGDIGAALGMTQSAISHQLRVLKQAKLVKFRRDGKTLYYSLADDHVRTIIGMGMEHLEE